MKDGFLLVRNRLMSLTSEQALRAYAMTMNTLDASHLEPLLADDFHYASQWVFDEMESKAEFLDYIVAKLETIRECGELPWAEMGWLDHTWPGPCVVMAQGKRDDLVALVVAEVADGKIRRLDMCCIPPPQSARRSGEYPGRTLE